MRPRLHARRAGIALPMAILLVGFITAGIIGAFGRMTGETRTLDSTRTMTQAFALAERGLEARAANGDTVPDSVRYTFPDGTVDVRVRRIRGGAPQDTTLWLIRSTATMNGGRPGRPPARRSVAQVAIRSPGSIDANAAWTSLSGLRKNGTSGLISGVDGCNPANVVAGAAVPEGMFELKSAPSQTGDPFEGSPPVYEEGTQAEFASSIHIDWASIIGSPPALEPDITCTDNEQDTDCLPMAQYASDPNYYPVVYVDGDFTMGSNASGQGLLIVRDRLTFTGGQETWRGLILVGSELIDNGTGWVSGAVISGLNVKIGLVVPESEIVEEAVANGNKTYRYDSCEVANALGGAAKMSLLANAWIDNWSAW